MPDQKIAEISDWLAKAAAVRICAEMDRKFKALIEEETTRPPMPLPSGKWITHILGDLASSDWEISLVREDNHHGLKSYGWFDENKLFVSHNGGPGPWRINSELAKRLLVAAQQFADELNKQEISEEKL